MYYNLDETVWHSMDKKELKQKIRKLKKLELMNRYGLSGEYIRNNADSNDIDKLPLVWKEFFDLNHAAGSTARYTLPALELMDENELKQVYDEFWFWVYYRMYQEKGIQMMEVQNPELLSYLGLPYDADQCMVKKRFHELCKQYHPDEGGRQDKFVELIQMMEKYN